MPRLAKAFLLCLTVLQTPGCTVMLIDQVAQHEQSQKFAIPTSHNARLEVPFVQQAQYYCGPASLTMVSLYHGISTDQKTIADFTFVPDRKGSLQVSMLAATRKLGLVPYVSTLSINQLVLEVRAGHPVVVLQNNGLRFLPRWHYAVVVGYDTDAKTFLLHSGANAFQSVAMDTFQRSHNLAERWSLVALPAGEIPETASPEQVVKAAADLEALQQIQAAQLTYLTATHRWPNNEMLHLGLGNTFMQQNRIVSACKSYRAALTINPRSAPTLNNYAYCTKQMGCHRSAVQAARCAVALDRSNSQSILNTAKELENHNQSMNNAPGCPIIRCKTAADKS